MSVRWGIVGETAHSTLSHKHFLIPTGLRIRSIQVKAQNRADGRGEHTRGVMRRSTIVITPLHNRTRPVYLVYSEAANRPHLGQVNARVP